MSITTTEHVNGAGNVVSGEVKGAATFRERIEVNAFDPKPNHPGHVAVYAYEHVGIEGGRAVHASLRPSEARRLARILLEAADHAEGVNQ